MQCFISTPSLLSDSRCHTPGRPPWHSRIVTPGRHLILALCILTQVFFALTLCQLGFDLAKQVIGGGSLVKFQEVETQAQVTIVFLFLVSRRYHSAFIAGIAKGRFLAQAKRLAALSPIAKHTSILDLPAVTTLLACVCLPQSTSLLTDPCRRLTSPFPQCQDLLYRPPTYVMTFWIVSSLLSFMIHALERLERGWLGRSDWHWWHRFTVTLERGLPLYLARTCGLVFCLRLAFGDSEFAGGLVSFPPTRPLMDWVVSSLAGATLAMVAIPLYWILCRFGILSHQGAISICGGGSPSLLKCQEGYPSFRVAIMPPIATLSLPVTPPRRIAGKPRKSPFKRSPLTMHTFEPPQQLAVETHSGIRTNRLEEADITHTGIKFFPTGSEDPFYSECSTFGNLGEEQEYKPLMFVLKTARSGMVYMEGTAYGPRINTTPKGSPDPDSPEDEEFLLLRPGSRLGFNDDDKTSSSQNSTRVYDGDSEGPGAGSYSHGFYDIRAMQPPTIPRMAAWGDVMDSTPSPCSTPPSLLRSPSPLTPEMSSTSDEENEEDWDAFSPSQLRPAYDWAKAATLLGDYGGEHHETEDERRRVFRLARNPKLYTIDEEYTDDETEPDHEV